MSRPIHRIPLPFKRPAAPPPPTRHVTSYDEAALVEPDIARLVDQARWINPSGASFWKSYERFKARLSQLVGWHARHPALRRSARSRLHRHRAEGGLAHRPREPARPGSRRRHHAGSDTVPRQHLFLRRRALGRVRLGRAGNPARAGPAARDQAHRPLRGHRGEPRDRRARRTAAPLAAPAFRPCRSGRLRGRARRRPRRGGGRA